MQVAERHLMIVNAGGTSAPVLLCMPWICCLPPGVLSEAGLRAGRAQSNLCCLRECAEFEAACGAEVR